MLKVVIEKQHMVMIKSLSRLEACELTAIVELLPCWQAEDLNPCILSEDLLQTAKVSIHLVCGSDMCKTEPFWLC